MAANTLLLTCEHGGLEVPYAYRFLFEGQEEVLQSHRGWDPGTLVLGQHLAKKLSIPLVYSTTTRLLIEMNRSLDHGQLFSDFSGHLPLDVKEKLITDYYLPYRKAVMLVIESQLQQTKRCLHFSLHSFTPVWHGQERQVDIGLLFDPDRQGESDLCLKLKEMLKHQLPDMSICFNEPYLGTDDGLTTYLRTQYEDPHYLGIEIEVNQKWVQKPEMIQIQQALLEILSFLKNQ